MPAAKSHYASNHAIDIPASRALPPNVEKPEIERDPLTSFEHFHYQAKADLSNWMIFDKPERLKRAAVYGSQDLLDAKPIFEREEYRWTHRRRHKVLNYIMWIESIHPKGDREVAAVAFNALFPRPGKPKKAEEGKTDQKPESTENGAQGAS